ncbi:MAG: ABC transporter ATP-binding protein [Phycisphaerales bacterium]|nr:ABC transporter ATP-binding protein [Phycisphaerales bacterium]
MSAQLTITGLTLESRAGSSIIKDVSLQLTSARRVALVGESGSGKSMTLLAIAGLLPGGVRVTGGSISLNQRLLEQLPPRERRAVCGRQIGVVFQEPMTALNPVMRIDAQLKESRLRRPGADASGRWCVEALGAVGLPRPEKLLRSWPHQLSGGMRQRVLVAMALAPDPEVILADEPTTALDPLTRQLVLDQLSQKAAAGASVLLVSHDLAAVRGWADDIVVMRHGRICERGGASEVLDTPAHPYTRGLLACAPTLAAGGPLQQLEDLMEEDAPLVQGRRPWLGDAGPSEMLDLGGGRQIGVSIEP